MVDKSKCLFITTPNDSLFMKREPELALGSSMVAGGLEYYGIEVDYFDFNLRLNGIPETLENYDSDILLDLDSAFSFLESPKTNTLIYKWISMFLNDIQKYITFNKVNYNFIALSFIKNDVQKRNIKNTFIFGIILAIFLSKQLNKTIHIGGKHVLDSCYTYLKTVIEYNNNICFELDGAAPVTFPKKMVKTKKPKVEQYNIPPKYDIINKKDLKICYTDIFSENIINKFPKIKDIENFTLFPFTFSKNCLFNCAFCSNDKANFKVSSVSMIVDNLEHIIQSTNNPYFRFFNSNINVSSKFVIQFCNELVKRNVNIKFSDSANLRPKNFNAEVASALREVGCIKLWFGAETISPKMLKIINKGITPQDIKNGLIHASNNNIWASLNFIVNMPMETEDDFNCTYNFIKNNISLIDTFQSNIFMLTANSDMYDNPEKYNIIKRDTNSLLFNQSSYEDKMLKEKLIDVGKLRQNKIINICKEKTISYMGNGTFANDSILFALSQIINNKKEKLNIFDAIIEDKYINK